MRLFEPSAVSFCCSCSRERTRAALASLGRAEIEELLEELGSITMDCEFCNQQYRFARADMEDVLGGAGPCNSALIATLGDIRRIYSQTISHNAVILT